MRNLLTIFIFFLTLAVVGLANPAHAEDYYQTGYKYGKEIGWEIGCEEAERSVAEYREPQPLEDKWPAFFQEAIENRLVCLLLKEVGIKATSLREAELNAKQSIEEAVKSAKTTQDKEQIATQKMKHFIQQLESTTNRFTMLLQNDAFGQGFAQGLADGYKSRTKDALYNHIQNKLGHVGDWDQGYLDGHNRGHRTGWNDKRRGNPSNWLSRHIELLFQRRESEDAQYTDGFRLGFKTGYEKGYSEAPAP